MVDVIRAGQQRGPYRPSESSEGEVGRVVPPLGGSHVIPLAAWATHPLSEELGIYVEILLERSGGTVEITNEQLRAATELHYGTRRWRWLDESRLGLEYLGGQKVG